jgi:hypothetical protein
MKILHASALLERGLLDEADAVLREVEAAQRATPELLQGDDYIRLTVPQLRASIDRAQRAAGSGHNAPGPTVADAPAMTPPAADPDHRASNSAAVRRASAIEREPAGRTVLPMSMGWLIASAALVALLLVGGGARMLLRRGG